MKGKEKEFPSTRTVPGAEWDGAGCCRFQNLHTILGIPGTLDGERFQGYVCVECGRVFGRSQETFDGPLVYMGSEEIDRQVILRVEKASGRGVW